MLIKYQELYETLSTVLRLDLQQLEHSFTKESQLLSLQ